MRTIQNFGKNKYKSKPKTEVRPTYFRKTFSSDRTGKICIPSNSEGKVVFRTKNEDSVRINGKKPEGLAKDSEPFPYSILPSGTYDIEYKL